MSTKSVLSGNSLFIVAETVGDAWIEALKVVFFRGRRIKTEYDRPGQPQSWDVHSMIEVTNPCPDGIDLRKTGDLRKILHRGDLDGFMAVRGGYIEEILDGSKDEQIGKGPSFPYTYHDRLFAYKPYSREDRRIEDDFKYSITLPDDVIDMETDIEINLVDFPSFNQIDDYVVKKLKEAPYSRRAQAITWRPLADPRREDGPCLQRVWCRVINGKLVMCIHWRSRDLYGAWGANMVGLVSLQKKISEDLGYPIGHVVDYCDSLHIYGKDVKPVVDIFERMRDQGKLEPEYFDDLERVKKEIE